MSDDCHRKFNSIRVKQTGYPLLVVGDSRLTFHMVVEIR